MPKNLDSFNLKKILEEKVFFVLEVYHPKLYVVEVDEHDGYKKPFKALRLIDCDGAK